MCGIAGIVDSSTADNRARVAEMTKALAHRGPDGDGLWSDGVCTLGHRRLKVLDLTEHASQPMASSDGRYLLVYNGEIYNFAELRSELGNGRPWKSTGDTEVLLRCFEKWGANCLPRLNGMFAFAVWDTRERSLFCARDRFGIKPFFYAHSRSSLAFASEIAAFLGIGWPAKPHFAKITEFLQWGALDYSPSSWIDGITTLPAGHYLLFKDGNVRITRYWWLPDEVDEAHPIPLDEASNRFSQLLRESIRLQVRSDREVGVHLSGGVDSTVTSALAREVCSGKLASYTFGYEESEYDERPFARAVADALGIENHVSVLSPREITDLLPRVIREEGEPFTSFRQVSHHKLYADYSSSGSTVVLESSGGDEIGAGYSSHLWGWFLDSVRNSGSPTHAAHEFLNMAAGIGISPSRMPSFILGSAANLEQVGTCTSDGMPYLDSRILSPDFLSTFGQAPPTYPKPFKSQLRNYQFLDLVYAKLPRGLRYVERASSAVGREARLPLLDHRLVILGFQADPDAKIGGGHLRRYMKEAAQRLLPPQLLAANKRSVADPQRDWLRGSAADWIRDLLSSRAFTERGIFDAARCSSAYKGFLASDPSANSLGIFQFLIVEMWFREIIDGALRGASTSNRGAAS